MAVRGSLTVMNTTYPEAVSTDEDEAPEWHAAPVENITFDFNFGTISCLDFGI